MIATLGTTALTAEWANLTASLRASVDVLLPLLARYGELVARTDTAHCAWIDAQAALPATAVDDAMEAFYRSTGWEACEELVGKITQSLASI